MVDKLTQDVYNIFICFKCALNKVCTAGNNGMFSHCPFLQVFHMACGLIPAGLLIGYCNLFIGDAVLCDYDPEVYEPEQHEFYKVVISTLSRLLHLLFQML